MRDSDVLGTVSSIRESRVTDWFLKWATRRFSPRLPACCPLLGSCTPLSDMLPLVILSAVAAPSILPLFEETGAYLRGHFRLSSGLHSPEYLQCAKVLSIPAYAERLGRELGRQLEQRIAPGRIEVVVAPAMGGIIIGHEVARALNVRSLFAERDGTTKLMTLRRGFEVIPRRARRGHRRRHYDWRKHERGRPLAAGCRCGCAGCRFHHRSQRRTSRRRRAANHA